MRLSHEARVLVLVIASVFAYTLLLVALFQVLELLDLQDQVARIATFAGSSACPPGGPAHDVLFPIQFPRSS